MTEHLKNVQPSSKTRSELIIIKTNKGGKIKQFLQQENINYEIYQEGENPNKKISDEELGQAYREA
jgi:hypothetical protein